MTVDYKNAKHICNVIRRQIQSGFPNLYIDFILHPENGRMKAFSKEIHNISEHPAGPTLVDYIQDDDVKDILQNNRSCFIGMSQHRNPGFLGFLKSEGYLALAFINFERFRSEETLRNHVLHLTWHAIELYDAYINNKETNEETKFAYSSNKNIISIDQKQTYPGLLNLKADIFSASLQTLMGRDEALNILAQQRMHDTLSPEKGFFAENFPFPVCLDTLELLFEKNLKQYRKTKKPVLAAKKITEDVGKTFESTSIEQWRSFAIPAHHMAWNGHAPEVILGAALYTGEDAYAQSIADMISERMSIKPEIITNLQDFNPFAGEGANIRAHRKQAKDIMIKLSNTMTGMVDYRSILDVAHKQSHSIVTGSPFGWCSNALLRAIEVVNQHQKTMTNEALIQKAYEAFEQELEMIEWDTLVHFHHIIMEYRRDGINLDLYEALDIMERYDEFTSICITLSTVELMYLEENSSHKKMNISDFMSQNTIKKK